MSSWFGPSSNQLAQCCPFDAVFVTALDVIVQELGGGCLKRSYIFSHRMHNKHAQQSAVAILPCS